MIVAIVCVGLAGVVLVLLLRLAVAERRALRTEARQVQAAWLAESALERAAARLAADPDYPGETWEIAAEPFGGKEAAVVRIEVGVLPGQPGRREVRVQADYPDHPHQRARKSKQVIVDTNPSSQEPGVH